MEKKKTLRKKKVKQSLNTKRGYRARSSTKTRTRQCLLPANYLLEEHFEL